MTTASNAGFPRCGIALCQLSDGPIIPHESKFVQGRSCKCGRIRMLGIIKVPAHHVAVPIFDSVALLALLAVSVDYAAARPDNAAAAGRGGDGA